MTVSGQEEMGWGKIGQGSEEHEAKSNGGVAVILPQRP